ncbi:uncharacterized protein Z519_02810 [Cladophialophora bantiana CBS 173.52]|uniref:Lysine-specific metallo-endopeptidase domain-containing protein n=1 Tax=Cladophialophora bantiana (strain ATCC 10958 / CBS 173.52 / CDC B-1940 / NIH 8579) TaxID=1442370 RepID=A0A0D2GGD9_CLAB1|nr:uncharacterized protein Z519_02810 [Cladophialophora bantiana CBS 173.52]KIW97417.1 hypothetical protein Z519_02810 [Cladophialophora bantiana CBS 173.52]
MSQAIPFAQRLSHLESREAVAIQGSTRIPDQLSAEYDEVEGNSFFAIERSCKGDTRNIAHGRGFKDRRDYYVQAVKDMTAIAHSAQKWPQLGTDASDLYFGKGADDEQYSKDIVAKFQGSRKLGAPTVGLRSIYHPNLSIGCYVNNTADLFSTISRVSCCGTFFTVPTIDEVFDEYKSADPSTLHLDWMRTGGSYLLHELMHTTKITQTRPHIIDQVFDGGKRIYGPKDCAKAAKSQSQGGVGLDITTKNADSYASFAIAYQKSLLAMYWKDVFQGNAPPPAADNEQPPAGIPDLLSDNDASNIDFSSPDPTPVCAGTPADKPSASQSWIAGKITSYCEQISSSGWVVNSTLGQYGPVGYAAGDTTPASANDLWISASFDPSCSQDTGYQVDINECEKFLNIVLNGCNTDSVDAKYGGQVEGNCALWNITTRMGHNPTPPNGIPPSPLDFPNGK